MKNEIQAQLFSLLGIEANKSHILKWRVLI